MIRENRNTLIPVFRNAPAALLCVLGYEPAGVALPDLDGKHKITLKLFFIYFAHGFLGVGLS